MDLKKLLSHLKIQIESGTRGGVYSWVAEGGDIEITGAWSPWDGCFGVDVWDNGKLSRRLTVTESESLNEVVGDAIEKDMDDFLESLAYDARSRGVAGLRRAFSWRLAGGFSVKHTPGPWHVESTGPDGARVTAIAPVAWCGNNSSYSKEATQTISPCEAAANARLIAAAPEMLEALCNFVAWFNKTYPEPSTHPEHEWNIANRVIAKAMGENQ